MNYPVNTIYPCIQGEGVNAGVPMILLRLQGCGVDCPWCDTKETWVLDEMQRVITLTEAKETQTAWCYLSAGDIAKAVTRVRTGEEWVLLTGGEPANYDLTELLAALKPYKVAIETSGTRPLAQPDWLTVSPKWNASKGLAPWPTVLAAADEIKFVITQERDLDTLIELISSYRRSEGQQICVQPVSLKPKATALCLAAAHAHGWRLSIQMHKLIQQP